MANFCILRTKKLKTNANVGASVSHCLRTRDTPNADEERTKDNWNCWKGSPEEVQKIAMKKYRNLLPDKVRKNGVRAVELMMTASPEAFQKMNAVEYLNTCHNWARDKFGQENVFLISHHLDETTPHVSMYIVPIDDKGKLNCRHFLGGKEKMIELQDDFYKTLHEKFQHLERGERGSKARHQSIQTWYGKAERLENVLNPPKKEFLETQEDYIKRYQNQLKPVLKSALENSNAKKEVPKVRAELNLEKARNQSSKVYIQNLTSELKDQKERADKAEKKVDDISRRIDETLEVLEPRAKGVTNAFNDEYAKIKERDERPRNRSNGFERS